MNMRIEYSGGGADAATEQAWWDLDDADAVGGGWTVYDPNGRLTRAPVAITGYPGEYQFDLTSGWGSAGEGDLSGAAAGVTIYRTPRQQDGSDWQPGSAARLTMWLRRVARTANQSLVIGVGQIGGDPSISATKIGKGFALLDAATCYNGGLSGTSGAGAWSFGSSDYGIARCIETVLAPIGRAKSTTLISAGLMTGGRQYMANNLFTTATAGEYGATGTPKEAFFIAANAAGSGTRSIRVKVRCGTIPEGCAAPSIWPNGNLAEKNVCLFGDSQWYGTTGNNTPWTMLAVERFLSRLWDVDFPAFRFEGPSNNLSAATAAYLSATTLKFAPTSGTLLATINTNTAANIAALVAAGETPDIVYLCAGANDASGGANAATILGYYTSIANAIKATFPSCKVYAVAGQSIRPGQTGEAEWATVTASLLAAPPTGCDGPSLDWNTWKRGTATPSGTLAFFEGAADWHPKPPATPTAIDSWDTFAMDPVGADYSQNGCAAWAYAFAQHLVACSLGATSQAEVRAVLPPILTGEVRPYTG